MPSAQRVCVDFVLGAGECARLTWLLQALAHTSYRPHVVSVTAWEVARCDPRLLVPLAAARHAALQAVEAALGREAELFTEWSGLIAWQPGSSIGWHADNNRDYLAQRSVSAVLYLNTQGPDFAGGTLRFRSGAPDAVAPRAGRLAAYGSGPGHEHGVDAVSRGDRRTLTLWFTEDPAHGEDQKILELLEASPERGLGLPSTLWAPKDSSIGGGGGGREEDGYGSPGLGVGSSSMDAAAGGTHGAATGGLGHEEHPPGDDKMRFSGGSVQDVRVSRIAELGLAVELPDGPEGPAGLRWAPDSGSSGSGGGGGGGGGGGSSGGGGGAGAGGGAGCYWCGSLQDASLLAHYVAYRQGIGASKQGGGAAAGAGPGCWAPEALEGSARELAGLLDAWGVQLRRLLPIWRAHGFLVMDEPV